MPVGGILLHREHALWERLGVDGTKTMSFCIVPGEKDIQPSVVADIGENEHARKFVEEALGEWCLVSLLDSFPKVPSHHVSIHAEKHEYV